MHQPAIQFFDLVYHSVVVEHFAAAGFSGGAEFLAERLAVGEGFQGEFQARNILGGKQDSRFGVHDLAAAHGLWRVAGFEVLADVPGRNCDIARAVRNLDGGTVEIKPHGLKMDTDRLQRQIRGRGKASAKLLTICP